MKALEWIAMGARRLLPAVIGHTREETKAAQDVALAPRFAKT
jgi:hypothetical protein